MWRLTNHGPPNFLEYFIALKGRTALAVGYLVIWLHADFFLLKILFVLIFVWKPFRVGRSMLRNYCGRCGC
jgi:hypothetical protein